MIVDLYIKPLVKHFDPYLISYLRDYYLDCFNSGDCDLNLGAHFLDPKSRLSWKKYDVNRILFFYWQLINITKDIKEKYQDKLQSLKPINIQINNYQINIIDGYHRLAAHILANKETIRAET